LVEKCLKTHACEWIWDEEVQWHSTCTVPTSQIYKSTSKRGARHSRKSITSAGGVSESQAGLFEISKSRNSTKPIVDSGLGLIGEQNKYKFGRENLIFEIFVSKRVAWSIIFFILCGKFQAASAGGGI
jgi:hypothetical protein